jgi:hypothetical protein
MNNSAFKSKIIFENFWLFAWFAFGMLLTLENIQPERTEPYDAWFGHQLMLFYLTFVY